MPINFVRWFINVDSIMTMQNLTALGGCWKQLGRSYVELCTCCVFCEIKALHIPVKIFLAISVHSNLTEGTLKTIAGLPMQQRNEDLKN